MKQWKCDACYKEIEVYVEYEPKICCSGLKEHCACMGLPINPIFCDECEEKIFGNTREENNLREFKSNWENQRETIIFPKGEIDPSIKTTVIPNKQTDKLLELLKQ